MAGPRLLDKKVVASTLAEEQRQQIQKGIKIAKEVDKLRSSKEKEAQELSQLRQTAMAAIHAEIASKQKERDRIAEEVRNLVLARERAIQPLTELEDSLNKKEAEIRLLLGELELRQSSLSERQKEVEEKDRKVSLLLEAAETAKEESKTARNDALIEKEKAGEYCARVRAQADGILSEARDLEKQLSSKSEEIESAYLVIEREKKEIQLARQKIERERLEIKAAWKNLEQTAERIKRGTL